MLNEINEMTKQREFPKEVGRLFLIYRQSLLQDSGKQGTLHAVRNLECIQRDPISVIHRNQHLVLHNRVFDYDPSYLAELLYKDRLLFEYWCNEKSIIPIEDFPYFRYRMQNPSQFHSPFYERIKRKRRELKDHVSFVLSEIRKRGPLSSKELAENGEIKRRVATNVLNLLWDFGELMIHHVEGNRRYYDLTEYVLTADIDNRTPSREEYAQFMVEKHMRAYGLADTRNWRFGWLPLKAPQRKEIVEEMVNDTKLFPVKIEGVKHVYYVLKEHLSFLESSNLTVKERVHFVAPLDNLLWNRRLISEIFDFNYSWEVYKVPEKRVYGYYVMPILFGSRFVGRLDPKLDRKGRKMIINSIYLEKETFEKSNFISEFAETFRRFLRFHDVSQFSIEKTKPEELRHRLLKELSK